MAKVDISNIVSVYSGKCGCMCGCNGKYSYNPAHQEYAGKERGYAVSGEDCSERSVKIIAGKVLNHPNVKYEEHWAYVEDRAANKHQVVYFKKAA